MLGRGHFVMLCFGGHAQLPQLHVQFVHEAGNSFLDAAKVMVIHFLTLGRGCAKKGAACKDQVFSLFIQLSVDEEIFLLCTATDIDLFRPVVAEKAHDTHSLSADCFCGTQQRRFLVQGFPGIGIKSGGNI